MFFVVLYIPQLCCTCVYDVCHNSGNVCRLNILIVTKEYENSTPKIFSTREPLLSDISFTWINYLLLFSFFGCNIFIFQKVIFLIISLFLYTSWPFQHEIFQLQIIKTYIQYFFSDGCFPYGTMNMVALNAARSSQLLHIHLSHT